MAVTNFIPEVWAAQILENFKATEIVAPSVTRSYEGDARVGNTVHITSFNTPTISDYSVTRTLAPEDLTDSGQALTIDQEKAFSYYVDDIDGRQAAGGMDPVTMDASRGLVEDAETFLINAMLTGGTAETATVTTGDEAFNLVLQMRTALSATAVKAPLADRFLLVNPEFSAFLLGADSKLVDVDTAGDAAGLREATLGRLLGFRVIESPLLQGTGATPEAAVAYHRSAVGHVSQLDKVEALRETDKFADIIRGLHVYGSKVVRPTALRTWQAA